MPTEAALHIQVAAFLRVALKPPTIWTTIGHGGGGKVRGARLKAMGVAKGWPDLLVMSLVGGNGGPRFAVVGLELKAKGGRQSAEQLEVERAFFRCGAHYILCRSVEEVESALRWCKVPLHATTMRAAA